MFHWLYLGVLKSSNMNCSTISGGNHVAPKRTDISLAVRSTGCTASSAATFSAYSSGENSAYCFAVASFSLTLPERYSSAGRYFAVVSSASLYSGFLKITPFKSLNISSSVLPVRFIIYGISTFAFSARERAYASDAVSTNSTLTFCLMVRFENISALRAKLPSSSSTSREDSRQ